MFIVHLLWILNHITTRFHAKADATALLVLAVWVTLVASLGHSLWAPCWPQQTPLPGPQHSWAKAWLHLAC